MADFSKSEFEQALVATLPALWRFAMSLSGTPDLADDLSQKTCLRAVERSDQIYDLSGIQRWVMTICRSVWYNEVRAQALRKTQTLDHSTGLDIASDVLPTEMNIFAREVFALVMALPEAHRAVVLLVLVEGHTYKETAGILDIPIGTVMSRLSSARAKLKPVLSETTENTIQRGQ